MQKTTRIFQQTSSKRKDIMIRHWKTRGHQTRKKKHNNGSLNIIIFGTTAEGSLKEDSHKDWGSAEKKQWKASASNLACHCQKLI